MAKRTVKSLHTRMELPKESLVLNDEADHILPHLVKMAKERARSITHRVWQIRETEFDSEREIFRVASGPHDGLYHMLTSAFLYILFLELDRHRHVGKSLRQNTYLIAAISQREMTLACNLLDQPSFERISGWSEGLQISMEEWRSHLQGARNVTRLARCFIREGATIYLPTAAEDLFGKIDLIVTFKGRSEGLCIQVKSDHRPDYVGYSAYFTNPVVKEEKRRLAIGTKHFQETYRGIWIPIYLCIGFMTEQEYLEPNEAMKLQIHNLLCATLDEHSHDTLVQTL